MNLPAFTHPWILLPAGGLALLALLAGLWAQTRMGQGVRVVGQRPWRLGLGSALMLAGLGVGQLKAQHLRRRQSMARPPQGNAGVGETTQGLPRIAAHTASGR